MEIDRTFRDINGIEWRVSHVAASAPATPADDGWLSFEHGSMERRLSPFPANWHAMTLQRLEQMCRVATAVERETVTSQKYARVVAEPVVEQPADTTPAEGSEAVVIDVPSLNEHVSVLANAYPARESRFTFRG